MLPLPLACTTFSSSSADLSNMSTRPCASVFSPTPNQIRRNSAMNYSVTHLKMVLVPNSRLCHFFTSLLIKFATLAHTVYNMGVGRFECPRHFANGFQVRYVCQFHHTPSDMGECSPPYPSSESISNPKDNTLYHILSIPIVADNKNNVATKYTSKNRRRTMPICPECLSRNMVKFGKYGHQQKWQCKRCGYTTIYPRQRMPKRRRR